MTTTLVIGAGIVGTLTAYYLARAGHKVVVIEARPATALATSFANGSQLSYAYADPLGSPEILWKLPHFLQARDSPVRLTFAPEWARIEWYLRLLWQCLPANTQRNKQRILSLNLYSREQFLAFMAEHPDIAFDWGKTGKLHLFFKTEDFATACIAARKMDSPETPQRILSAGECVAQEPALAHLEGEIAGAIFSTIDMTGDAHRFSQNLALLLSEKYGVQFHYGTSVSTLIVQQNRIQGVCTTSGRDYASDHVVLATSHRAPELLRPWGIHLPLYPLKGYSITAPILAPEKVNKASITDHQQRLVYARLGDRLRVAGFADVVGDDARIDPSRIALLKKQAEHLLPGAADLTQASEWAGLRPALPASTPALGATKIANLWLNVGHGMLGWTMGHGTAKLVADAIVGEKTELDLGEYRL
jgi:D-amino-acid dehydrogenase